MLSTLDNVLDRCGCFVIAFSISTASVRLIGPKGELAPTASIIYTQGLCVAEMVSLFVVWPPKGSGSIHDQPDTLISNRVADDL